MAGIVQPDKGKVLLDGQDLFRRTRSELHGAFALVSPDLPLLRGSVRYNLTYGAKGVTDKELAATIDLL